MACSSPLYGVRTKMVNEDGLLINGYKDFYGGDRSVHIDNKFRFMRLAQSVKDLEKPFTYATPSQRLKAFNELKAQPRWYDVALIPCGRCMECRLEYSRQWANRQMLEAATSDNNWFLTLTYDDEHLPKNSQGYPTLVKNDVKKFMKDLREYYSYHYGISGIRFFAFFTTYLAT